MIENIQLSLKGIWSHKMRSFLTMLGIIIGIAAIIAIVSTIKGTNEQIKQNLIGSGNNVVNVKLSQDGYEVDAGQVPYGTPVMTSDILEEVKAIENVENALDSAPEIGERYWFIERESDDILSGKITEHIWSGDIFDIITVRIG